MALAELGKCLVRLGRYEEGADTVQRALDLDPNDESCYYVLGYALRCLERDEESAGAYEAFLTLVPDAEDAAEIRAWVGGVRASGAPAAAAPFGQGVPDEVPGAAVSDAPSTLGSMLVSPSAVPSAPPAEVGGAPQPLPAADDGPFGGDELDPAVAGAAVPAEVIEISPVENLTAEAEKKFQAYDFDGTIESCERALESEPRDPDVNLLLGRALIHKEDYLRAVPVLNLAEELNPQSTEPAFYLAQAYERRQLNEEAIEAYQRFLSRETHGTRAEQVRASIRKLQQEGVEEEALKKCEYCFRMFSPADLCTYEDKPCCEGCLSSFGLTWEEVTGRSKEERESTRGASALATIGPGALPSARLTVGIGLQTFSGPGRGGMWGRRVFAASFVLSVGMVALAVLARTGVFSADGLPLFMNHWGFTVYAGTSRGSGANQPNDKRTSLGSKLIMSVTSRVKLTGQPARWVPYLGRFRFAPAIEGAEGREVSFELQESPPDMRIEPKTGEVIWDVRSNVKVPSTHVVRIKALVDGQAIKPLRFELEVTFEYQTGKPQDIGADPARRSVLSVIRDPKTGRDMLVYADGRYREGSVRLIRAAAGSPPALVVGRPFTETGEISAVAVYDVDGDGKEDVIVVDWMNGQLRWLTTQADLDSNPDARLGLKQQRSWLLQRGADDLAVGDLFGDGKPLMLVSHADSSAVTYYGLMDNGVANRISLKKTKPNRRNFLFILPGILDTPVLVVLAADDITQAALAFPMAMDQDAGRRFNEVPLTVRDVGVGYARILGADRVWVEAAGDENENENEKRLPVARIAVALWSEPDARIRLLEVSENSITTIETESLPPDVWPLAMAAADINGDGLTDLAISHSRGVLVYLRARDQHKFLLAQDNREMAGLAGPIALPDLNGDGMADVVCVTKNRKLQVLWSVHH